MCLPDELGGVAFAKSLRNGMPITSLPSICSMQLDAQTAKDCSKSLKLCGDDLVSMELPESTLSLIQWAMRIRRFQSRIHGRMNDACCCGGDLKCQAGN